MTDPQTTEIPEREGTALAPEREKGQIKRDSSERRQLGTTQH
jgi:hypothetical protein